MRFIALTDYYDQANAPNPAILLVPIAAIVYFLPWIIAANRKHPNRGPIVIVNVFLGCTLIGWVVALAWSLTAFTKPPKEAP